MTIQGMFFPSQGQKHKCLIAILSYTLSLGLYAHLLTSHWSKQVTWPSSKSGQGNSLLPWRLDETGGRKFCLFEDNLIYCVPSLI